MNKSVGAYASRYDGVNQINHIDHDNEFSSISAT